MANVAQRSFASGELAPALYARTDLARYAIGLRTCRNFLIARQGGAVNRPGTAFVGATPANGVARLVPFVFNAAQTVVLEFSDLTLRFIRDGGYVLSGGAPYTVATPYAAADLFGLQYVQSADVLTLVHRSYAPRNLARISDINWTLSAITFAPSIAAPTGLQLHPGPATGGTTGLRWVITAVDAETGQESLASDPIGSDQLVILGSAQTLTWDAVPGAGSYNVYKGIIASATATTGYGFVGATSEPSFYDSGLTADMLDRAPVARNPFASAHPSVVGYYQERRVFAGTDAAAETLWASRVADYDNFTVSTPSQDDDAITFTVVGRQVNAVRHLIDVGRLLVLTSGSEIIVGGDGNDVLRPTDVNPREKTTFGASTLRPIKTAQRLLFVQDSGSIVRDFTGNDYAGYASGDLTVVSAHLFDGYTLVDWAYQKTPHSIVWAVRSDGVLLGLTILDEEKVLAWHRHDTDGVVESVCCVPEGAEDRLYLVVRRTIDGATVRYVERLASRAFADVRDVVLMDAALTYDGRNTNASKTMTLSGGTTWVYDETLTCTCSAAEFAAGDVGNEIQLTGRDGSLIRFRIIGYTGPTIVTGRANRTVPSVLRAVATADWARAVDQFSGLDHLEGKAVSVFADGFVAASPNNPSMAAVVVASGRITLDRPYAYVHVGLPYVSDLETLDLDTPSGPSIKATSKMQVNHATLWLEQSRGLFVGPEAPEDSGVDGLFELKVRDNESSDDPVDPVTDAVTVTLENHWNSNGRLLVRQVDPVPASVLAVIPAGYLPQP